MINKKRHNWRKTHPELHINLDSQKTNWLRAAVLGANDGIVSIAGLVVGIAGATSSINIIFTAGLAGLFAGALSMAAGEYVSVSSQRDIEEALLDKERNELKEFPEEELEELKGIYKKKGLSEQTARAVANELTAHNPFLAHVEAELKIDPHNLTNPAIAAFSSAASFTAGAIVPLLAVILPPEPIRVPVTFASVVLALMITGLLSARAGGADPVKATRRIVVWGIIAMVITYTTGKIFGVSGV